MSISRELQNVERALKRKMGELHEDDEHGYRRVHSSYQSLQARLVEYFVSLNGANKSLSASEIEGRARASQMRGYFRKGLWLSAEFQHYKRIRDRRRDLYRGEIPEYKERKKEWDRLRNEKKAKRQGYFTDDARAERAWRRRDYHSKERLGKLTDELRALLLEENGSKREAVAIWRRVEDAWNRRHDFVLHPRVSFNLWVERTFLLSVERDRRQLKLYEARDVLFDLVIDHPQWEEEIRGAWGDLEVAYLSLREFLDPDRYAADFAVVRPEFEKQLDVERAGRQQAKQEAPQSTPSGRSRNLNGRGPQEVDTEMEELIAEYADPEPMVHVH